MRRQAGFTLLEIAIALVTIGLLFGATLAGQELVTGARVRNLIAQQDAVQAAYLAFQDRYRGYPGDYAQAMRTIPDVAADGNGKWKNDSSGNRVGEFGAL